MPVTFIGDVHGWSDRLDQVWAQVEGQAVVLGDLIDRGPDAPGVMDRVRAWCDAGRAACILGNHEYVLVRALGFSGLGLEPDEDLFQAWRDGFGGQAVCRAFGVAADDPAALRTALGDRLEWLAHLPWLLEGVEKGRHWIAVHAGLGEEEFAPQLAGLRRGWEEDDGCPAALFSKPRAFQVPYDLPGGWCVASGHLPIETALVTDQRLLCDTSGGMPKRVLSAVVWPEGRVITSG
jgi:hypothetical protein